MYVPIHPIILTFLTWWTTQHLYEKGIVSKPGSHPFSDEFIESIKAANCTSSMHMLKKLQFTDIMQYLVVYMPMDGLFLEVINLQNRNVLQSSDGSRLRPRGVLYLTAWRNQWMLLYNRKLIVATGALILVRECGRYWKMLFDVVIQPLHYETVFQNSDIFHKVRR